MPVIATKINYKYSMIYQIQHDTAKLIPILAVKLEAKVSGSYFGVRVKVVHVVNMSSPLPIR